MTAPSYPENRLEYRTSFAVTALSYPENVVEWRKVDLVDLKYRTSLVATALSYSENIVKCRKADLVDLKYRTSLVMTALSYQQDDLNRIVLVDHCLSLRYLTTALCRARDSSVISGS